MAFLRMNAAAMALCDSANITAPLPGFPGKESLKNLVYILKGYEFFRQKKVHYELIRIFSSGCWKIFFSI